MVIRNFKNTIWPLIGGKVGRWVAVCVVSLVLINPNTSTAQESVRPTEGPASKQNSGNTNLPPNGTTDISNGQCRIWFNGEPNNVPKTQFLFGLVDCRLDAKVIERYPPSPIFECANLIGPKPGDRCKTSSGDIFDRIRHPNGKYSWFDVKGKLIWFDDEPVANYENADKKCKELGARIPLASEVESAFEREIYLTSRDYAEIFWLHPTQIDGTLLTTAEVFEDMVSTSNRNIKKMMFRLTKNPLENTFTTKCMLGPLKEKSISEETSSTQTPPTSEATKSQPAPSSEKPAKSTTKEPEKRRGSR